MDKIEDVEFEEVNSEDKAINGTNQLYYNTSQVAQMLDITDSKVRYYTKVFDDILKVEIINKQRKYKQSDIDKLKYMCELKNEGMSIKQIEQFCQEVDFNENGAAIVKESNPLSIKALAQALSEENAKLMTEMKFEILNELKLFMENQLQVQNNNLDEIKESVAITVDEIVSEKLTDAMSDLNNDIKEIKEQVKIAVVSKEEIENFSKNKSWFSRLFR